MKILIFSNKFNFWVYFLVFFGFGLFLLSFLVISSIRANYHYGLISSIFESKTFYLTTILIIIICYYIDYLWKIAEKMLFFQYINLDYSSNNNELKKIIKSEEIIRRNSNLNKVEIKPMEKDEISILQESA